MHHSELRNLLLQNKQFLKDLYESEVKSNTKHLLLHSSNEQLNILLNILYYITQGEIPIKKHNYKALQESKKLNLLHKHFDSNLKLNAVLNYPLKEKTKLLLRFLSILKILLYPLFHN